MKGTMYVFKPGDDQPKVIEIVGPATLDWLKRHLDGGFLEAVPGFNWFGEPGKHENTRCVAFCDEEGKNKGLPYNEEATVRWCDAIGMNITEIDHLVGPVIVLVGDDEFLDAI
jgi:hypothetical protein